MEHDKIFQVSIATNYKADVYLSCSWRPDAGQDASWLLVKEFDRYKMRAIGDVPDLPEQDDERILRIMGGCRGFAVVLPFRENSPSKTSPFIIREIRIAARLGMPMMIFRESRVNLNVNKTQNGFELIFPNESGEEMIVLNHKSVFGAYNYDAGSSNVRGQIVGKVDSFINSVIGYRNDLRPYAFLVTRIQEDFEQARNAIKLAVEHEAGIPCLWSSDPQLSTNISGIRERTRMLIKNSEFIIAEFSLGTESPEKDNPSRAFEAGMAEAYQRPTKFFSQEPTRDPFFAIGDRHIEFWKNEQDLYTRVRTQIRADKESLCRRVYNYDLTTRDAHYTPTIALEEFTFDPKKMYVAPYAYPLTSTESLFVAIGFSLIALSISLLFQELFGFTDTFDFTAITAAIFTFAFASNFNIQIRRFLGKVKFLRWLIPTAGVVLLILSLYVKLRIR